MPIISFVHRVEQMHYLIKNKATGTPEQFAGKVGLSRRSLFLWIEQLRDDFNFPIAYDAYRKTYFYTTEGEFVFGFNHLTQGTSQPAAPTHGHQTIVATDGPASITSLHSS